MPSPGYLPILILTADVSLDAKSRALAAGASDFLTKPFERIEVLLRIGNLLDTRRLYLALEAQNRSLEQTVRERTERLLQSEKVATMGSLLAGVAHELNNPLAALSGHAQLLRQSAQEPALVRRAEKIDQAATRCVRIVRNFLSLARQRVPERSQVWLKAVVEEAVELLAYELRTADVELALDLEEGLPRLWADPHQLNQVLVNLLANANQAMRRSPRPRRIAITARHEEGRFPNQSQPIGLARSGVDGQVLFVTRCHWSRTRSSTWGSRWVRSARTASTTSSPSSSRSRSTTRGGRGPGRSRPCGGRATAASCRPPIPARRGPP